MDSDKPVVGIVMGSDSDWPLVKKACETLDKSFHNDNPIILFVKIYNISMALY